MAVGKTTYGKQIAEALQYNFIDLDALIEKEENKTIVEIFETVGEPSFRILEQQYLHKTFTLEKTLISCGGGTPCFFDNMEKMNENGLTVWLKASPVEIAYRVQNEKNKRPLLKNISNELLVNEIELKLQERTPYYKKATYNFFAINIEVLKFISIFTP
jgi:shikimate kinase